LLQNNAVRAVNQNITARNWLVGYWIVEFEQNGKEILLVASTDKREATYLVEDEVFGQKKTHISIVSAKQGGKWIPTFEIGEASCVNNFIRYVRKLTNSKKS